MDFSILHLSDLHIIEKNGTYSNGLSNLINDIEKQCERLKNIILVITGDIIDKAEYTTQNIRTILTFFDSLNNKVGHKIIGVEIVPGNHDKKQHEINKKLIGQHRNCSMVSEIPENDWPYYLLSYTEYINLSNQIRLLFCPCSEQISNSYYVDYIEQSKFNVAFINMDTSWSSFGGKEDERKLCLDKTQLNNLKESYQKKHRNHSDVPCITILTAHHPVNWLKESDETYIKSWLLNSEFFNIDFYLCGHTHDRKIQSIFDMCASYTTLVTGFGWDEKEADDKKDKHRYSIYNMNIKNNCCEIIIRKTCENGNFDYDNDVLFTEEEKKSKKKYFPIKPLNNRASIKIPVYINKIVEYEYLFVDDTTLQKARLMVDIFTDVTLHMTQFQAMHIKDFFEKYELNKQSKGTIIKQEVYDNYFYKHIDNKEVNKLFSNIKNRKIVYKNFVSYLWELCSFLTRKMKNKFNAIEYVRLHFRKYYKTKNEQELYIAFCQASYDSINSKDSPEIRDVSYDGMIRIAFEENIPFVCIHNSDYNKLPINKYENFITMAPQNHQNTYAYTSDNKEIIRPYLSAALSLTCNIESNLLDILNYLDIGNFIFKLVFDYIVLFKIDLNKIIEEDFIDDIFNDEEP